MARRDFNLSANDEPQTGCFSGCKLERGMSAPTPRTNAPRRKCAYCKDNLRIIEHHDVDGVRHPKGVHLTTRDEPKRFSRGRCRTSDEATRTFQPAASAYDWNDDTHANGPTSLFVQFFAGCATRAVSARPPSVLADASLAVKRRAATARIVVTDTLIGNAPRELSVSCWQARHRPAIVGPMAKDDGSSAAKNALAAASGNPRAAELAAKQVTGTLTALESAELDALLAWGGSGTMAELHRKEAAGELSVTERAELEGRRASGNDRMVGELYAKQVAGEITHDEIIKLKRRITQEHVREVVAVAEAEEAFTPREPVATPDVVNAGAAAATGEKAPQQRTPANRREAAKATNAAVNVATSGALKKPK